jgi:hypothetical protein
MQTEQTEPQFDPSEFITEGDTTPLTPEEYDRLGGFSVLDAGKEVVTFDGIYVKKRENRNGRTEMSVRVGLVVNPDLHITNPGGRKGSIFFTFPNPEDRAANPNLETQHNINKVEFKSIAMAFLGCRSSEDPGEYPFDESGFASPMKFIEDAQYAALLKGKSAVVDISTTPAGTSGKRKDGSTWVTKKDNNNFANWAPVDSIA